MLKSLNEAIAGIGFNPLECANEETGKVWKLEVLKAYRSLLCNSDEKNYLRAKPARMTPDDFNKWRHEALLKLLKLRPSADERLLRANTWLIYHLQTTEIVNG